MGWYNDWMSSLGIGKLEHEMLKFLKQTWKWSSLCLVICWCGCLSPRRAKSRFQGNMPMVRSVPEKRLVLAYFKHFIDTLRQVANAVFFSAVVVSLAHHRIFAFIYSGGLCLSHLFQPHHCVWRSTEHNHHMYRLMELRYTVWREGRIC